MTDTTPAISTMRQDSVKAKHTAHYMRTAPDITIAERIASHYVACANIALDLRRLISSCAGYEVPPDTRAVILHMRREIERHHLNEFGTTIVTGEHDDNTD